LPKRSNEPEDEGRTTNERLVSLHPLDPKEALADLMKVEPEPKDSEGQEGKPAPCKLCKGSGVNPTRYNAGGRDECPRCGGTGEEPSEPDDRFRGGGSHQKQPKK
jgi:hypothetical protein